MTMQGLHMPDVELCSASELLSPITCPSSPSFPSMNPVLFEEPEDTYGQACMQTGITSSARTIVNSPPVDTMASTSSIITNTVASTTVDIHGISGWDKVNALTRALINLNGLSVSNEEARLYTEHQMTF